VQLIYANKNNDYKHVNTSVILGITTYLLFLVLAIINCSSNPKILFKKETKQKSLLEPTFLKSDERVN
jgi:hypothetical protein